MNQPDYDLDIAPMTLEDYVEIITDDIEEAVAALSDTEIRKLCEAIQKKIGALLDDEPAPELDRRDRWWDL